MRPEEWTIIEWIATAMAAGLGGFLAGFVVVAVLRRRV